MKHMIKTRETKKIKSIINNKSEFSKKEKKNKMVGEMYTNEYNTPREVYYDL